MTGFYMRATLALNGLINQIYSTFCQTLQPFYNVEKKVPDKKTIRSRRATRRGKGGGGALPCPFLKFKKIALILEKRTLIVSILMLNLLFIM